MNQLKNLALLLTLATLVASCQSPSSDQSLTYHISPTGADTHPGSAQQPFATLTKARDAVRASRANGKAVAVVVHGGVYRLNHTLEFNAADSGTAKSPAVWKAAPGETVRIIGGQRVQAGSIKPVTDEAILQRVISPETRKNLLEIDLGAMGIKDYGQVGPRGFRRPYITAPLELFVGGRVMPIARWPNPGEKLIPIGKVLDKGSVTRNGEKPERGGKFVVSTDRPRLWLKNDDVWISGLFNVGYADDTVQLAAITETTNGLVFTTAQPHMYGFGSGKAWNTWYALNLLEEIDLAGEYAVDRQTGKLYFLPPKGVDIKEAEVMVSTLGEPLMVLEGASHLRFEGLTFECSRGMGVYIEGGEAFVLSSCVLRNLGMLGVCLGQGVEPDPLYQHGFTGKPVSRQLGSWHEHIYNNPGFDRQAGRNHRIENCTLHDLGTGAISLGGGDRKTLTAASNTVFNCEIYTYNRWDRTYKAAINIDGVGNRIQHCLIYDAPGSAIYLHGNSHLIENNEIHHVMQEGDDMGAFYMGRDPSEFGTVIRNNYFHDIGFGKTHSTWAVYYDDAACGTVAYGNVFVRAGRGGTFHVGGGKHNFIHDNIFIDCGLAIHEDNRLQNWAKNLIGEGGLFERRLNLMKVDQPPFREWYPSLANYWQDNSAVPDNRIERNLLVRCKRLTDAKPEWGPIKDNWETSDNPGFVNMAGGDYRLKSDAEAFKKIPGFKPGDCSKMGRIKAKPTEAGMAESQHDVIGMAASSTNATKLTHSDSHWFRQTGLGMFLHWGLAPLGNVELSWGMIKNTGYDKALNNKNKITPTKYFALAKTFNPTNYHPEHWLQAAKDAGFGYAVLTTRHHDGYALWPSKYGDFNTGKYLGGRDLVREYVEACRKAGLKVGLYYSPPDWYREREYRSWNYKSKGTPESPHLGLNWEVVATLPERPAGFEEKEYAYINGQLTELLTQYGPIDYLWFDGGGGSNVLSQEQIRKLQPDIIINDRQHGFGDVATAHYEYKMPTTRPEGWWEHCFSMVGAWCYTKPEFYKPTSVLIERIAQARAMGGNVLANYGPRPDGEMPELFYKQMAELKEQRKQVEAAKAGVTP